MNNNNISRQHESTTLNELQGQACEDFLAIYDNKYKKYVLFYLKACGVFHCFYLDAGLLFWHSHENPDAENDLNENADYINFGEKFKVTGVKISSIVMMNNCLNIEFENQVNISLKNDVPGMGAELVRSDSET